MNVFRIAALVSIASILVACSDSTDPEPSLINTVQFHGMTYDVKGSGVQINTVRNSSGELTKCWLTALVAISDEFQLVFSVRGPDGEPRELLVQGEHAGGSSSSNFVGLNSGEGSIGTDLGHDQLSIVWESISVGEDTYSGHGYIDLKERIDFACPDSLATDHGFVGQGDPEYDSYNQQFCEPGYYLPKQKIQFICKKGFIEWEITKGA